MNSLLQKNLISTKEASALSGYNADYLSRLCREKKIASSQVGRTWLIERASLEVFMETQLDRKIELAENLARERELEYRKANSSVTQVFEAGNDLENKMRVAASSMLGAFSSVRIPRSMPVMSGRAFAAGLTAVILGASVTLAGSGVVARAGEMLLASAFEVRALVVTAVSTSNSLAVEKTAEFSRIAEDEIKKVDTSLVRAADTRVAMFPLTLGGVIENSHEPVEMTELAYARANEIFETYPEPIASTQTVEKIMYAAMHPKEVLATIAREAMFAYSRLGVYALNDIQTVLALHLYGVEAAANGLLSVSDNTRDIAGQAPLAIGNAFVTTSSAVLSSYEHAVYAYVENIDVLPSAITGLVYGLGNGIGGSVAMGVQTAPVAYEESVLAFVEESVSAGSMISEGSFAFGKEADRTVSGLLEAEDRAIVQSVESVRLAVTSIENTTASAALAIESVPSVATDKVLGIVGGIALRIESTDTSMLSASPLVSLDIDRFIPGFLRNVTAVLAHAVGSAFHGIFGPLAGFFGASEEVGLAVIPSDGSSFSGPSGATGTEEAVKGNTTVYTGPVTIVRNEYPTVTYGGVPQSYVDERYEFLRRTLYNRIEDVSNDDTFYGEVRDSGIYDSSIVDSTFTNGEIIDSTITGGTITGAALDVSTSTITGSLTVNGDIAANAIVSTSSTSTNATSTNLFATNASFTNLLGGSATITNATSTSFYATLATIVDGFFTNLTATLATITNAVITNLTATNATLTNATSTNATSTNLFATNLTATSATSTNLFATSARITTGIIDALTSPLATITTAIVTNLTATNSTLTNATSTNSFALSYLTPSRLLSVGSNGVATSTSLSSWVAGTLNQLTVTDNGTGGITLSLPSTIAIGTSQVTTIRSDGATSTFGGGIQASIVEGGQYIAGPYVLATSTTATSAFSGNIAVGRNATFGTSASDLLTVNSSVASNLIPTTNNTYDFGSTASYWRRGYIDDLTVNNLSAASTSIAGTVSNSFTINADNATNDTEDVTLIFKRGTASPNALMTWNSSTDRFEFNMPVFSATGLFTSATSTNFGTTNFTLNSNTFTSLLGTGLSNVSGALTVDYDALDSDFFRQGGNSYATTAMLGTNDANDLAFETNGTTKMTILSGGNVGIGTTTPTGRLSIVASTTGDSLVIASTTGARMLTVNPGGSLIFSATGQSYKVVSGADEYGPDIFLNRTIGTEATANEHGIIDRNQFGRATKAYNSYDSQTYFTGTSNYDHYAGFQARGVMNSSGTLTDYYSFYSAPQASAGTITNVYGLKAANPAGAGAVTNNYGVYIDSQTKGTNNFAIYTDGTTKSYFGGNVGIGTTTPSSLLDLYKSTDGYTKITVRNPNTGTDALTGIDFVQDLGGVGSLYATGNTFDGNADFGAMSGFSNSLWLDASFELTGGLKLVARNGDIGFYAGSRSTQNVTISGTNGNLGVGSTTPYARLSVKGAGTTTGVNFQTTNSSNSPLFTVLDSGNVGIGTTTPAELLTIDSGSLRFESVSAGRGILASSNGVNQVFSLTRQDTVASADLSISGYGGVGITGGRTSSPATSAYHLYVNSAGNVGIGSTTPAENLTVNGAIQWGNTTPSTGTANIYNSGRLGTYNSGASPLAQYNYVQPATGKALVVWNANSNIVAAFGQTGSDTNTNSYFAGNVGIGTTSPAQNLHIDQGTASTLPIIQLSGAGGTIAKIGRASNFMNAGTAADLGINAPTSQSLYLGVGGSSFVTLKSTGNVGIGTTTPIGKLTVYEDSDAVMYTANPSANVFSENYIDTTNNVTNHRSVAYAHQFYTSGSTIAAATEKMRIHQNGNVGIGTTSPEAALTVNGDIKTNGGFTTYATNEVFKAINGGTSAVAARYGNSNNDFYVGTEGNTAGGYFTGALANSSVLYSTRAVQTIIGGVSRMIIDTSGNVGIGTTSPEGKLDVNAGLGVYSYIGGSVLGHRSIRMGADASGYATIQGTGRGTQIGSFFNITLQPGGGNVGIGTVSPGEKLEVSGNIKLSTSASYLAFGNPSTPLYLGSGNSLLFSPDNNEQYAVLRGYAGAVLAVGGNPGLLLNASSNVGIGTTNPGTKLHVLSTNAGGDSNTLMLDNAGASGITTTSLTFANGGAVKARITGAVYGDGYLAFNTNDDTEKMRITAVGRVGIGTTTPQGKFHVKGSDGESLLRVSGATGGIRIRPYVDATSGTYIESVNTAESAYLPLRLEASTTILGINGNVGIGTTTPLSKLQVSTSGADAFSLDLLTGSSHDTGIRIGRGSGANGAGIQMVTSATDYLSFYVNGSALPAINTAAQMVLTEGGNVGIGTTGPLGKLHVLTSTDTTPNTIAAFDARHAVFGPGTVDGVSISKTTGGSAYISSVRPGIAWDPLAVQASTFSVNPSSGTTAFHVTAASNVGIGTVSPGSKLQVSTGNSSYVASTAAFSVRKNEEGYGLFVGNASSGNSWLQAGYSDGSLLYDLILQPNGGKVGIGTTTPSEKLSVAGDIFVSDATDPELKLNKTSGTQKTFSFNVNNDNAFQWLDRTAGLTRLYLTTGGNMGIGDYYGATTNTPQNKLSVAGSASIGYAVGSDVAAPTNGLIVNGNVGIGTTTPQEELSVSKNGVPQISLENRSGTTRNAQIIFRNTAGPTWRLGTDMSTNNNTDNFQIYKDALGLPVLTIDSAGDVGIGTGHTNPLYPLDVNGLALIRGYTVGVTAALADAYKFTHDGGTSFVNNQGGSFGVGTTTPTVEMEIGGSSSPSLRLRPYFAGAPDASGYYTTINAAYSDEAMNLSVGGYKVLSTLGYDTPTQLLLYTGNTERLRINSSGNVGIGTSNLFKPLTVEVGTAGGVNQGIVINSSHAFGSGQGTAAAALVFARNRTIDTSSLYAMAQIDGGNESETTSAYGYLAFSTANSGGTLVERMRTSSSGNVGIGTTTPDSKLNIQMAGDGTGLAINSSYSAGGYKKIIDAGQTGSDGYLKVNDALGATVSYLSGYTSSPSYFLSSVGIGTSTPVSKFSVYQASGAGRSIAEFSNGNRDRMLQVVHDISGDSTSYIGLNAREFGSTLGRDFVIQTGGTERMRVAYSTGNVGIGTVNPGATLDVKSQINLTNATGNSMVGVRGTEFGYAAGYKALQIGATSGTYTVSIGYDPSTNASPAFTGDGSEVIFRNGVKFLTPNAANNSYLSTMTMLNGNVGIGETAPSEKLVVAGQGTGRMLVGDVGFGDGYTGLSMNGVLSTTNYNLLGSPGQAHFWINRATGGNISFRENNGTDQMTIASGGNVGIGVTAPDGKLHILNNTASQALSSGSIRLAGSAYASSGWAMRIPDDGSTGNLYFDREYAGWASTPVLMLQRSTGNVGIGTTNPTAKLTLNGTAGANPNAGAEIEYTNALIFQSSSAHSVGAIKTVQPTGYYVDAADMTFSTGYGSLTERMRIQGSTGNVGIGTTTPSGTLDIYKAGNATLNITGTNIAGINLKGDNGSGFANINTYNDGTLRIGASVSGYNSGTTDLVIKNGYVGMGTASPLARLQVGDSASLTNYQGATVGIVRPAGSGSWLELADNTTYGSAFRISQDSNSGIAFNSNGRDIGFRASGYSTAIADAQLVLKSSGNVGVGAQIPLAKLHVQQALPTSIGSLPSNVGLILDSNTHNYLLFRNTADNSTYSGLQFQDNNVGGYLVFQNFSGGVTSDSMLFGTYQDFVFQTGTSETVGGKSTVMTIKQTGNVGIGTTNPLAIDGGAATRFHTKVTGGTGNIEVARFEGGDDTDNTYAVLRVNHNNDRGFFVKGGRQTGDTAIATMGLTNNGGAMTDIMTFLGSNVGIGNTSPGEKLTIEGNSAAMLIQTASDPTVYRAKITANYNYTNSVLFTGLNNTEIIGQYAYNVTVGNSSGNVGVGTTGPTQKFSILATGISNQFELRNNNQALWIRQGYKSDGTATPAADTNNVQFQSSGSSSGTFSFTSGNDEVLRMTLGSSGIRFNAYGAGTLVTDASGNITASSDERLKDIEGEFTRGLDDLMNINPINYRWKASTGLDTVNSYSGFSAQDVQNAIPEAIDTDPQGYLTLSDRPILAASVNAIKELNLRTLSLAPSAQNQEAHSLAVSSDASIAGILTVTGIGTFSDSLTAASVLTDGSVTALSFLTGTDGTLPQEVLTGGNADLFKMASYAITGIQALSERTDLLATRIDEIDARVTALENGSTADEISGAVGLTVATIKSALQTLGIYLENGVATFETLVFRQLAVAKDTNGDSSAGSETILAGNTVVEVENPYVLPTSKIFVTFTGPIQGAWYISNKEEGKFRVTLATGQSADVSFDYFILQTEGQLASPGAAAPIQTPNDPAPSNDPLPPVFPGEGTGTTTPVMGSGDTTPPSITLNGPAAREIDQGATWIDQGATASDETDGDLTSSIQVQGTVDTGTPGTYTVSYSVSDAAGNEAHVSRIVSVQVVSEPAPSPEPAPEPAPSPEPAPAP